MPVARSTFALALIIAVACAGPASGADDACPAGTLGVARALEVDTTGGPWFGEPHGDPTLLAPGEVVLTFDDGPSPSDTRKVLAALAEACTKATFFMVGEMAAEHPEMVKEVAEAGHTIGTHTWSHRDLARLSEADVIQQVEAAFNVVQQASPVPVAAFFRYPYLSSSQQTVDYLKRRNIGQFAIDIDSSDWRVRSSNAVIRRVMAGLKRRGRGIILMHDIHKWTADAVPALLADLKAGGYKVVQLKAKQPVVLVAGVGPPTAAPRHVVVRRTKHRRLATRARRSAYLDGASTVIR